MAEENNRPESSMSSETSFNLKMNAIQQPFTLNWSFGFNCTSEILNLSSGERTELFFSSTSYGIFYDFQQKTMSYVEGHKNTITNASMGTSRKYLVTADMGKDSSILIWNTNTKKLVRSYFEPYAYGVNMLRMSPDSRLLVSVGLNSGNQWKIDLWQWTLPDEHPKDSCLLNALYGTPVSIDFHPNKVEMIMITFEYSVVYLTWNPVEQKVSTPTIPAINDRRVKDVGKYCGGTFVKDCHESIVATAKGYILMFGNTLYLKPFKEQQLNNENVNMMKCFRLCDNVTCISSKNGLVLLGDETGCINFYDSRMTIIYSVSSGKMSNIASFAFNNDDNEMCNDVNDVVPAQKDLSQDWTLERNLFAFRSFFAATSTGNLYRISLPDKKVTPEFIETDSIVVALDVHVEFPYIIVAYKSGRLCLINYETHTLVNSSQLPITKHENPADNISITYLKYCPRCLHLACGKSNGFVWILDPALMRPKQKVFKYSVSKVVRIIFSPDSAQLAYFDTAMTVFLLSYDTDNNRWMERGKVRGHYKDINHILFHMYEPHDLYSLSNDRHIIKYNNSGSRTRELSMLTRERVEQKDIPIYFICYPRSQTYNYFLTATDTYKFKFLLESSLMTTSVGLGPCLGCFKDSPVCKMELLPNSDNKYMVFCNKTHIGLQLLPPDGNPYKYVSSLGHPQELVDFVITPNGKYLFTYGRNDSIIMMRNIVVESVEKMYEAGGTNLEPYYCLLEGGKDGWLFQEMQDLFFYMQILTQGENLALPRVVCDDISVKELPDLVRACGFYPTEYEIENMLTDIRFREYEATGRGRDTISFYEFVKLFINHRMAKGYTKKKLEYYFHKMAAIGSEDSDADIISASDFIKLLTTAGEPLTLSNAYNALVTLMREEQSKDESDFWFIPDDIDFPEFVNNILGIDFEGKFTADKL